MHVLTDSELRQWTHPRIPTALLQPWTVTGDGSCDADCSDITSDNESSSTSLNNSDSHNEIMAHTTRRKQRREGSGNRTYKENTAVTSQTTMNITTRTTDSQSSLGSRDSTETEDDLLQCTMVQSRTYGNFIAPFVNFAHMTHRALFGETNAQEDSSISSDSDSHTSDEPEHRKAKFSRNRHL